MDIVPPADDWKSTGLSGKQLKRAEVTQDYRTGQAQVSLNFDDEGARMFADITSRNVGKTVAIFLDGLPISAPTVNEAIMTGSAVISGNFDLQEARLLSQRLNSGALPVPVELISQQKVDATLGADSLAKSLKAGIVGFIAVALFAILYYRLPGLVAVVALGFYSILSLAIFRIIGVTLTLSGIAGFILSVGMAVDANVLVFERLKEELRWGKSLRLACEEAFVRAWPSIRDSNITTLISCGILIWFGVGFVQGFAVTLAIGVLVSMFTAITVTRALLRAVNRMYKKDEANILFLGHRKIAAESKES
ncbi:MAG: Preprotein translocase subunit SecD [Candidatus Kaiserbacteria bacterium GW2011_GWA2_49_19]|uniref:Preprotein translocase subunit SecD n=1 Tax=Candidatus Kaiserbacteria bacterium GW2011_GWA2_49_19 TaxID=1618669 RepID=A0A0G1VPA1_9BACT|nr:MAG: Preprotein translocase subunit SecD [Candidatus Kaiserbacteria bacterium GW2011_GWA2_49_19]